MSRIFALIPIALLSGCQGSPCAQYLDVRDECYEAYGEITPNTESTSYCRDFTPASDNYFTCLADAYADADCTTDEGFEQAIIAATACSQE